MKRILSALIVLITLSATAAQANRGAIEQALRQLDQAQSNLDQARSLLYQSLNEERMVHVCNMSYGKGYQGIGETKEEAKNKAYSACTREYSAQVCVLFRDDAKFMICHTERRR